MGFLMILKQYIIIVMFYIAKAELLQKSIETILTGMNHIFNQVYHMIERYVNKVFLELHLSLFMLQQSLFQKSNLIQKIWFVWIGSRKWS